MFHYYSCYFMNKETDIHRTFLRLHIMQTLRPRFSSEKVKVSALALVCLVLTLQLQVSIQLLLRLSVTEANLLIRITMEYVCVICSWDIRARSELLLNFTDSVYWKRLEQQY